jgi:hypothetical protein
MADGLAWDDLTPELEGPGVGIRRMDVEAVTDAEYVEITRTEDYDALIRHRRFGAPPAGPENDRSGSGSPQRAHVTARV